MAKGPCIDHVFRRAVAEFEIRLTEIIGDRDYGAAADADGVSIVDALNETHPFPMGSRLIGVSGGKTLEPFIAYDVADGGIAIFYSPRKQRDVWNVMSVTMRFTGGIRPVYVGDEGMFKRSEEGLIKRTDDALVGRFHPVMMDDTLMPSEMDVILSGSPADTIHAIHFDRAYFGMTIPILEKFSRHVGYDGLEKIFVR